MDVLALHASFLRTKEDILQISKIIRESGREICISLPAIPDIIKALDRILESYFKQDPGSTYTDTFLNLYKACQLFSENDTLPTEVLESIDEFQAFLRGSFSQDKIYIRNHIMGYAGVISVLLVSDLLKKIGFYNHCLDIKSYLFATSQYGISKLDLAKSLYKIDKIKHTKGVLLVTGGVAFDGTHYVTYGLNDMSAISLWVEGLKAKSLTYYHPSGGFFQLPHTNNSLFFIERCSYDFAIEVLTHSSDFCDAYHVRKLKDENTPLYIKYLKNDSEEASINFSTSIGNYRENNSPKDYITIQKKNLSFFCFTLDKEKDLLSEVVEICTRYGAKLIWSTYSLGDELKICLQQYLNNFDQILHEFSRYFSIKEKIESIELFTAIDLESRKLIEDQLHLKRILHYQKSDKLEKWIVK